jgi:hypothetical protein
MVGFYPTNDAGGNALQNSNLIYLFELLWQGTPVLTRVAIFYTTSFNHLRQGPSELCIYIFN